MQSSLCRIDIQCQFCTRPCLSTGYGGGVDRAQKQPIRPPTAEQLSANRRRKEREQSFGSTHVKNVFHMMRRACPTHRLFRRPANLPCLFSRRIKEMYSYPERRKSAVSMISAGSDGQHYASVEPAAPRTPARGSRVRFEPAGPRTPARTPGAPNNAPNKTPRSAAKRPQTGGRDPACRVPAPGFDDLVLSAAAPGGPGPRTPAERLQSQVGTAFLHGRGAAYHDCKAQILGDIVTYRIYRCGLTNGGSG